MSEDRLTPLDASFLHVEQPNAPMHVGCVLVFDGDPPPYDDFVDHVERRLRLVPRYRQRLAWVPLGQGRPCWIDDEHFDIRYHVRATGLPRPGEEEELKTLAGRVFSVPLNREKPLWEMWLVEGLAGGRFAIVSKTHHAVVDGIAGLDILSVLFAPEGEADEAADEWRPSPSPSGASLLYEALRERVTVPGEVLRPVRALLRRPRQALGRAFELAVGVGALAWAGLNPAPSTPYNRFQVGVGRRFTWVRASLDDVKEIKGELGGTVNDVILTVVGRALRHHLRKRGEKVEGMTIKAFVPVSIRAGDQRAADAAGNEVAGVIAPLPLGCGDAATCLALIGDEMRELKESGQAVGAQALTELSGFAPATLLDQAARIQIRQRFINLVVTNVPGPQFPLYLAGRELEDIFPLIPLGSNLNLGIAIVSYNGTLNFGLVGDFDNVPDLEEVAQSVGDALVELADVAGISMHADTGEAHERRTRSRQAAGGASRPRGARDGGGGAARRRARQRGDRPKRSDAATSERAPATPAGDREPEVELAESVAERGAEPGAGPELEVAEPWDGYDRMKVAEIRRRLERAAPAAIAVTQLYERTHKRRRQVLSAAERALETAERA